MEMELRSCTTTSELADLGFLPLSEEMFGHWANGYYVSAKGEIVSTKYGEPRLVGGTIMSHGYRSITLTQEGVQKVILVHRAVYSTFKGALLNGVQIDHINRDRSDNRLENLRTANNSTNKMNMSKHRGTKNRYKGVYWLAKRNKYQTQVQYQGKHHTVGYFSDEEQAARAYDYKAVELFGEYACLNFP